MPKFSNNPMDAWQRDGFFIRMSKRRKANLLEIAANLGPMATPSDAIDHALSLAKERSSRSASSIEARLEDLVEQVDAVNMERRLDLDQQNSAIEKLISAIDGQTERLAIVQDDLRQLHAASEQCIAPVPSLSEWLSREVDALGLDAKQPVHVAARWQCTHRLSDRMASMEFAVDMQIHNSHRAMSRANTIRLPVVDMDSNLHLADKCQPFWFSCAKQLCGWSIEIMRQEPSGAIGEPIQELRM